MQKTQFKSTLFNVPTSQMILGTTIDGKPNFMALAWVTRVNFKPAFFAVSVNQSNRSHDAILNSKEFSLSLPSTDLVEATDYTGIVSARKTDKSDIFTVEYGELASAPIIQECPLVLTCKLHDKMVLPTNTLFIGELVEAWCTDDCLTDGKPDMTKIDPFMLSMPENKYMSLGKKVGEAWSAGKELKK